MYDLFVVEIVKKLSQKCNEQSQIIILQNL